MMSWCGSKSFKLDIWFLLAVRLGMTVTSLRKKQFWDVINGVILPPKLGGQGESCAHCTHTSEKH